MFLKTFCLIIFMCLHLQYKLCASKDVNEILDNKITSQIDNNVEPCEDFYAYACGNYDKQHPSTSYQDITTFVDNQYNAIVLNIMENIDKKERPVSKHTESFVERARVYFKACRSETKRNLTRYFEEIHPALQLNWPILEQAKNQSEHLHQWSNGYDFNAWSLLGRLQSHGLQNVLINQEILIDKVGELSIMMEPAIIGNKNTLPDKNILHVLLLGLGIKNPVKIILNLQQTNKKLVNLIEKYEETSEQSLVLSYADLELLYPNLNLNLFLRELMGRQLPPDTLIVLRKPSYFQHLNEHMWKIFAKPYLCNYLMMKFLYFLTLDSTADFNTMNCVRDLRRKLDLAVNFLYTQHAVGKEQQHALDDVKEVFANIVTMLEKYFQTNYLNLENNMVQQMIEKLKNVRLNIGNLPKAVTIEKIENFYATVDPLDENNYYRNHLSMLRFRFAKSIHYKPEQTHFIGADNILGRSTAAFYVPQQNMIILPFGNLLPPMYDAGYSDLHKYARLGFTLAHELVHAFDTHSLNFDSQGKYSLNTTPILKNEHFQNSLACLQSQLATDSIDERIADIVAMQLVYKILISKQNNHLPTEANGFNMKYFYLSLAQNFCSRKNLKFIDHDSDAERLNQIVRNSAGFSISFHCAQHSEMHPVAKCRLY